jgi:hypothetical protein
MNLGNWVMLALFAALVVCVILLTKGCNKPPDMSKENHIVDSITNKAKADSIYAVRYKDSTDKAISQLRRSNDSLHGKQQVSEARLNKAGEKVMGLLSKIDSLQNANDTSGEIQACNDLRQTIINDSALLIGYEVLSDSLINRLKLERGQADTVKGHIFNMFTDANGSLFEISRNYSILEANYKKVSAQAKRRFSLGPSLSAGLIGGKVTIIPGIGLAYSLIKF